MDAAMAQLSGDLIPKVRALCASVGRPGGSGPAPAAVPSSTHLVRSSDSPASRVAAVVIGVSTGGPNPVGETLPSLPADPPVPLLVLKHTLPTFNRPHPARTAALGTQVYRHSMCMIIMNM